MIYYWASRTHYVQVYLQQRTSDAETYKSFPPSSNYRPIPLCCAFITKSPNTTEGISAAFSKDASHQEGMFWTTGYIQDHYMQKQQPFPPEDSLLLAETS